MLRPARHRRQLDGAVARLRDALQGLVVGVGVVRVRVTREGVRHRRLHQRQGCRGAPLNGDAPTPIDYIVKPARTFVFAKSLSSLYAFASLRRPGDVGLPVRDHLQLVRDHVLRREELLRLAEALDDLQVVGPALRIVVAPALALEMARAVGMRELEHRVERKLRLERLLQVGQRAVRDLGGRPRVRLRELEAHDDALEEARVEVLLGRVLEVGGPDRVHVRRMLRPVRADQVLQLEALAGELGAEPFPGEPGVGLARRDGLHPRRARRHVPDGLRVDAELDEHRVDDHLPAGAAE